MKKKLKKSTIVKIVILAIVVVALIALVIFLWPYIMKLKDQAVRDKIKEYILSHGVWGYVILFAIQILQVVVAIIPGEPIEILYGFLFGWFGGMVLCLLGVLIGTIIIYFTVKKLGAKIIDKYFKPEQIAKYKFLNNPAKVDSLLFLCYFIPGTPKDLLTYLMPILPIKPSKAILIAMVARIPSVVSSTIGGDFIDQGNWTVTIIVFAVIGVLALVGLLLNNKFTNKMNKQASTASTVDQPCKTEDVDDNLSQTQLPSDESIVAEPTSDNNDDKPTSK